MKKLVTIFTVTFILTALLISCDKETPSSQGGGVFKVKVSITPPLTGGTNANFGFNYFQLGSVGGSLMFHGSTYNESNTLSNWEGQEVSVTKGQNIPVMIGLNSLYDLKCRKVLLEGFLDGKLLKSVSLELGQTSAVPIVNCKDQQTTTINFIIP
jgi:hypothetical protein